MRNQYLVTPWLEGVGGGYVQSPFKVQYHSFIINPSFTVFCSPFLLFNAPLLKIILPTISRSKLLTAFYWHDMLKIVELNAYISVLRIRSHFCLPRIRSWNFGNGPDPRAYTKICLYNEQKKNYGIFLRYFKI